MGKGPIGPVSFQANLGRREFVGWMLGSMISQLNGGHGVMVGATGSMMGLRRESPAALNRGKGFRS